MVKNRLCITPYSCRRGLVNAYNGYLVGSWIFYWWYKLIVIKKKILKNRELVSSARIPIVYVNRNLKCNSSCSKFKYNSCPPQKKKQKTRNKTKNKMQKGFVRYLIKSNYWLFVFIILSYLPNCVISLKEVMRFRVICYYLLYTVWRLVA